MLFKNDGVEEEISGSKLFVQNNYGEFVSFGNFQISNIDTLNSRSNNWRKMHGYKMQRGRGRKYKNPWRMLVDHKQYSYTIKAVCE